MSSEQIDQLEMQFRSRRKKRATRAERRCGVRTAQRPHPQFLDGHVGPSQLRQLKALHDEGILTDDEYETKRKALTDQL